MMARQKFKSIIRGSIWTFTVKELSCVEINIVVRNVNLSTNLNIWESRSVHYKHATAAEFHYRFREMSKCFICVNAYDAFTKISHICCA